MQSRLARAARGAALLLALAACAACADGDDGANAPPDLPRWTATPTLRLGTSDGGSTAFGRVLAAVADSTGRVYVADALGAEVRVVGTSGALERTIGRKGEGPGEFASPTELGLTGDGLWVYDSRLLRLTFFDAEGRPDSSRKPTVAYGTVLGVLGDGSVLFEPSVAAERFDAGGPVLVPVLHIGAGDPSPTADTIHMLDLAGKAMAADFGDGTKFYTDQPIRDAPVEGAAPDGALLAIAEQTGDPARSQPTFWLTLKDAAGRERVRRAVPYAPIRVPPTFADSAIRAFTDRVRDTTIRARIARGMEGAIRVPPTFPPVSDLRVGADHTIWVRLTGTAPTAIWLVFDDDARPLGRVELPADEKLVHADRRTLVTVGAGADDEPVVVRYTVARR